MSTQYTNGPPSYSPVTNQASTSPLLSPVGDGPSTRTGGDNIPDDFKYSTSVASCDLSIRQMFVRKVYTILSVQLLVTLLTGVFINQHAGVQAWALNNIWLFYLTTFGSIFLVLGAYFKAKSYPTNIIFLSLFTLFESYSIGVVSSLYDTKIVLEAVLITTIIFVGLTAFAFQTKYDFTSLYGYLGISIWILITVGFVFMFFPPSNKMDLVFSSIGALIFSIYILADTQMVMRKLHPDEEIVGAITLYLDIINLFLYILRILNDSQNN
ncbi:UPF0005-domain-containing protein [Nadsonia fulvescens var. elongata DSM 6958]|uniref:UPF0005-domain-containing protein n=1 Tax=Nadsonia fulvescens var. elongata DSM 6958 TaxID=857566 RepID=A0A1E3PF36_9ASCO|nr:UPF0005-domain-containing protein [Nadsonia fulvescens var. elongata DSM 6958]